MHERRENVRWVVNENKNAPNPATVSLWPSWRHPCSKTCGRALSSPMKLDVYATRTLGCHPGSWLERGWSIERADEPLLIILWEFINQWRYLGSSPLSTVGTDTDPKSGAFWTSVGLYNSDFTYWLLLSFTCPCRASLLGRKKKALQNNNVIS